jgi:thymidylate synthase (FAD)
MEFVDHSTVKLVKSNASDLDVALAAWVSNNGENLPADIKSNSLWALDQILNHGAQWGGSDAEDDRKRVKGLINFLYRERHMSPFEHGSFTFFIDTPIFVAREFMRHRTFSYNETSGRYKKLEPRFYLIDSERPVVQQGKVGAYRFDGGTDEQYGYTFASTTQAYQNSWGAYENMLKAGIAREVARNVLPVGTMTQFYATANPRNIMQFLLLRNDDNALYEIREVAKAIEEHFAKAMPYTYEAYKKYDWREEKKELVELRKKVAQYEAYESYADNLS